MSPHGDRFGTLVGPVGCLQHAVPTTTAKPAPVVHQSAIITAGVLSRYWLAGGGGGMRANASAVAAGRRHSVARRYDGTVLAVGSDAAGERRVEGWTDVVA